MVNERVINIHLRRLFGTVQVATAHLWSADPELACGTYRQTMALRVNDIEAHVVERATDGDVLQLPVNQISSGENGTLGRSIHIVELIACGWHERCQLLATGREIQQRVILNI